VTTFAGATIPAWAHAADVPDFLALREGDRPLVIVAPHGGRRLRPIRRGDSVNDLHTAGIAWELAERTGARAIVNHGLDRNQSDLNRISHLSTRSRSVLELLLAAIDAASAGGHVPLVLFVHGWNMVVPCCDIGIGLKRRAGRLTGRYPTLSRECFEGTIAAVDRELHARGVSAAIGRRYTASGRDNAAQLFSGRHAGHEDARVRSLARLSLDGRVDAAQLELGIPLRWEGTLRAGLLDGLCAALNATCQAKVAAGSARSWTQQAVVGKEDHLELEAGYGLQAVLDAEGTTSLFCGVEAGSPTSMAARFCIVATDGSMMLLVGEAEWSGERGRYALEGFSWTAEDDGRRITIRLRAPMIRYPTHEAYLDLEEGLAASTLVDADVSLCFDATTADYGMLTGRVQAGSIDVEVSTVAFVDRSGRRAGTQDRIHISVARGEGDVRILRSGDGGGPALEWLRDETPLGHIRDATAASGLRRASVIARVPVWRPLGGGGFARWTFGMVRCRFDDDAPEVPGLFASLEVFRRT